MLTSATALSTAAAVTVVADREADIFEMFACRPEGVEVLIRASHDRNLVDDTGKLFASLEGTPQQDHTVAVPARPGHKKREARIGVRFGHVMGSLEMCEASRVRWSGGRTVSTRYSRSQQ